MREFRFRRREMLERISLRNTFSFAKRRALCAILLFCLACLAARAERLPVRVYTTADGLGSSAVNHVLYDSRGFLWFCTRDGLSRFDGQRFTTYRVGRGATPSVTQALERKRGDYLVVLQNGGVYRFDERTPIVPIDAAGDAPRALGAQLLTERNPGRLYEDRAGGLWAATSDDGLYQLKEFDGRLTYERVPFNLRGIEERTIRVFTLCEARDGSLWATTNYGLIRRAPDGRTTLYPASPSLPLRSFLTQVYEAADGRIWVGSVNGVYVLKPSPLSDKEAFISRPLVAAKRGVLPEESGEVAEFGAAEGLDDSGVIAIRQMADGRIWIASNDGLSVFDGRGFHHFDASNGLGGALGAIEEDGDGNLWLASLNGAIRLATRGLSTFSKDDGLGDRAIKAIYQNKDGELYVVSGNWQVSRFNGKRFVTARPPLGDAVAPLWTSNAAFLDSAGAWWFLTERKLLRFDNAKNFTALSGSRPSAVYENSGGFKNGSFYRAFEDSRGDVWVSVRSSYPAQNSLSRWRRASNAFEHFGAAENFPEGRAASALCEDRAGNVWIGFYFGGLARFDGEKFTLFTSEDGLPEGFVTALYCDHAGRVWIAASSGLSRIDDPKAAHPSFVNYTTAQGLSSNNVRAIVEDAEGALYVGTVRGVDRLSPDAGRVRHYTMADGLADDFVAVAFRGRDGALWFGTQNGLSRLASEPEVAPHALSVLIGDVRVAGVKQLLSEFGQAIVNRLELDYTQANLQIEFFSLSFAAAERIRYQHKLEGADADWSAPATERAVTYANLAPGSYRFLVRAVNADGLTSREPAVVSFVIAPPVWTRWWFILAAAALFGASVYMIARANFRRKLELARVRARIATDLHDDIGASLSQISVLSEIVSHQGAQDRRIVEPTSMIADISRELVDSMSDIVWANNPARDHLGDLVHRMRRFASDLLTANDIAFQLHFPPETEGDLQLDAETRREIYMIFKESLNNLARHSRCARADISLELTPSELVLQVADDGRGFDASDGFDGNGLRNMRQRAAHIGGEIEIESAPKQGATVRLRVPLRARGVRFNRLRRAYQRR